MKTTLRLIVLSTVLLAIAGKSNAQLQWNSYDNTGALVTSNVASGGDATYGSPVTFTVPANKQLIFMTKTFLQIDLTNAGALKRVDFTLLASGGLYPGSTGRILGMGLFNDPGTPSDATDDQGYWADFNTGNPSFEMFYRPTGLSTFFQFDSAHKPGTGNVKTGYPSNSVPLAMQFQLDANSPITGISIGTSASTFAAAGAAMTNGSGTVFETAYINPNPFTTLGVSNFNEFAFMFNNVSTNPVQFTLSGINLVPLNPVITTQPQGYGGNAGDNPSFSVAISSNSAIPLSYSWYSITGGVTNQLSNGLDANGSTISGSSTTNLTISNAKVADSGGLFVVVSNAYGMATSTVASLLIASGTVAPTFSSIQPSACTVIAGSGTNINVTTVAVPAPTYYWYDNNSLLIQTGTTPSLTLNNVQPANAGTYSVTASNSVGTATTNFTINVIVTPAISSQPTGLLLNVGDPANFSVTASGTPTPSYQWYKNGSAITGATATNYSIGSVGLGDIGSYTVVVGNTAGSVTSSAAVLAVRSTMSGTPVSPSNGVSGVCLDTPFYISFDQTPTVGTTGKIKIYNVTNSSTPVDTIDIGANSVNHTQSRSLFPGDSQMFNYYPIIITGNVAAIYPHSHMLATNQTYFITLEPGVVVDASGAYYNGVSSSSFWQFSTRTTGPVNATNLMVAADGSGDFLTVQGAVDSIPLNNTNATLINIANGTYTEIVNISSKNKVTFRGQSRAGTIVGYPNNGGINGSTHTRMAFKVNANDVAVENLTLVNSTPQGGSQAEALMIESGAGHFILNNAEVDSRQDTVLANINTSQGYFYNSLVTGNFDYIWGGGNLFITNCEVRTIAGVTTPNLCAPRTDNGTTGNWPGYGGLLVSNGISIVSCQLTHQAGVALCSMSDKNGSQNGLAAFINCVIDTNAYGNADATSQTNQLLWEFGNLSTNGVALDNLHAPFISFSQLTNGDSRLLAAGNATVWLNGWVPQLAPNILSQPSSLTVLFGSNAGFNVVATGIPDPTYQWLNNGSPISGATNSSFSITNATLGDAGNYSVAVTTSAGSVTSSIAALTVNAGGPPMMTGPVDTTVLQGGSASFSATVGTSQPAALSWYTNGILAAGATASSFSIGNVQYSGNNAESVCLVASNSFASITNCALLTVLVPPSITSQPASVVTGSGQVASFSVAAFGVPVPTYQWYFTGSIVSDATNTALAKTNVSFADVGSYFVVIANSAGSVTSAIVTLQITNSPPVLAAYSNVTSGVGRTITVSSSATDIDQPTQSLSFSLSVAPSDATINSTTGLISWRPNVASSGTVNPFTVVVADNGTPVLSASNSFSITITNVSQPTISGLAYGTNGFTFVVSGDQGPDYAVQASADLLNPSAWITLLRTNSPVVPFSYTDTNSPGDQKFYRIMVGPPLP